jgi:hypothetical protein
MPRGASIITIYIIKVLGSFMKLLRINRLEMVSWESIFHWDNALVLQPSF